MSWADRFLHTLKENDVGLVTYVPENVLTPLIAGATAESGTAQTPRDPALIRRRFMRGLGSGRASALDGQARTPPRRRTRSVSSCAPPTPDSRARRLR
jgi:hypothetical protein